MSLSTIRIRARLLRVLEELQSSEWEVMADTEYLRDELNDLIRSVEVLLDKMTFEKNLIATQTILHRDR